MTEPQWTLVAEFAADVSLVMACRQLDFMKIRYDIRRSPGVQQLWVNSPEDADAIMKILQMTVRSDMQDGNSPQRRLSIADQLRYFPVVCLTLLLGVLGYLLVKYQFDNGVHWLTFQDFVIVRGRIGFYDVNEAYSQGQYWRLLTPAFLHFGIFHIAFNGLWLWELGRRVERLNGSFQALVMFLLVAVGSNIAQYWWSGPSLFGGLSGVVYGLLGYLWIRHLIDGHPLTKLPTGVIGFMLIWLLVCMSGIVDLFMSGGVANAAHAGGLLIGMVLAIPAGFKGRSGR